MHLVYLYIKKYKALVNVEWTLDMRYCFSYANHCLTFQGANKDALPPKFFSVGAGKGVVEVFYESPDVIHGLFGRYAFCKLDAYPRVKPINKVLFEVLTVSVAKLSDGERKVLRTLNASTALKKYVSLFLDESYEGLASLISTSTGMFTRIALRYDLMHRFLVALLAKSPTMHVSGK